MLPRLGVVASFLPAPHRPFGARDIPSPGSSHVKVLVVGSGGREHALVWKLAQSPRVTRLYCAPGNAGIAAQADCLPIPSHDVEALQTFALRERVDLTVVGPEAPLAQGIADEFRKKKLKIFGPTRGAAQIESSKSFAKALMLRHRVRTAASESFDAVDPALRYLATRPVPIVVKADGLAQGKGVVIAGSQAEAREAVRDMLERESFGTAGRRVVIEEFLDGQEVTVMAFSDGKTVVPMLPAQDHKRVGEGDVGPNTGGMGAYAPAPIGTPSLMRLVQQEVLQPVVQALSRMGSPFQGVLYAGLMLVGEVPYVLEFNARFGDPETQVVLPLLKTDLVDILEAVAEHRLDQLDIEWERGSAVCVVLASRGYPGSYPTGVPISGVSSAEQAGAGSTTVVFHAGTKRQGDQVVTAGGRVLSVTGIGKTLLAAREAAYRRVPGIVFDGCHYRSDIAVRALSASR